MIEVVKRLDFENKEIQNEILTKEHLYEEKRADLTGQGAVKKLKQALMDLKVSG